jgi:hypothetical protein
LKSKFDVEGFREGAKAISITCPIFSGRGRFPANARASTQLTAGDVAIETKHFLSSRIRRHFLTLFVVQQPLARGDRRDRQTGQLYATDLITPKR